MKVCVNTKLLWTRQSRAVWAIIQEVCTVLVLIVYVDGFNAAHARVCVSRMAWTDPVFAIGALPVSAKIECLVK